MSASSNCESELLAGPALRGRSPRRLGLLPLLLVFGGCMHETGSTNDVDVELLELGRETYRQNCLTCHQRGGGGVPGMHPSLLHNDWTGADPARLIEVILKGSGGPVEGRNSRGAMPEFSHLSDQEVAALATYIRNEFGQGASRVDPSRVARIRGN